MKYSSESVATGFFMYKIKSNILEIDLAYAR